MKIILRYKGGSGSGNYGHSGRPGKVGGSQPGNVSGLPLPKQFASEIATEYVRIHNEATKEIRSAMKSRGYRMFVGEEEATYLRDENRKFIENIIRTNTHANEFYRNVIGLPGIDHTTAPKGSTVEDWDKVLTDMSTIRNKYNDMWHKYLTSIVPY